MAESASGASSVDTLILGAGLTGLSCAYHLQAPDRYRLLEKADGVGGLARTRERPGGFLCDGTGHWLHLKSPTIRGFVETVLGGNLESRARRARIYSKGVYTHYPFQANTFGLPAEVVAECVNGLIKARYEERLPEPQNYKEWIRKEFGEGICQHFMYPYNEKIYRVPLETLAVDFAAKYIPRPSIEAVVKGALGLSPESLGYNASFVYPKTGGIGALPTAIHQHLGTRAELGRAPVSVSLPDRSAILNDGSRVGFSHLVNTAPLPDLVELLVKGDPRSVPDAVRDAVSKLRANSVFYYDVGIKGAPKAHQDYHWIYFPEASFPFYRVGSYSAVERSLAPAGCRSYYVECGHYGEGDPSRYEQAVIDGLRQVGLLTDEDELLFLVPNVLSPAYVLVDAHYEVARGTILDWLRDETPIISMGRYGRWQYNAMEDAMREGQEAAEQIRAHDRV